MEKRTKRFSLLSKALIIGITASALSSSTYLINNLILNSGGNWLWSVALRYLFPFPILFLYLSLKKKISFVLILIFKNLKKWVLWSTVGFGVFYTCLAASSLFAPSWLVASTFQITIVFGALLTPIINQKETFLVNKNNRKDPIPIQLFPGFILLLIGVFFLQMDKFISNPTSDTFIFFLLIITAAISYPLGNRKIIFLSEKRISTIERIFAMTLCNIPYLLLITIISFGIHGLPEKYQLIQSGIVAVSAGLLASPLFFFATELVQNSPSNLAFIESTQVGEVVFSLIGGIFILNNNKPNPIGWFGLVMICFGMILNGCISKKNSKK